MDRESFLALEVAEVLNDNFIPIKIDREERPDLDYIYHSYVLSIVGSAGHPINVFLTPDLQPIYGGMYWPGPNISVASAGPSFPESEGFMAVLERMLYKWREQEAKCRQEADGTLTRLRKFVVEGEFGHNAKNGLIDDNHELDLDLLERAYQQFEKTYDKVNGGFGSAPKFPVPAKLSFLLRLGQWQSTVKDIVGKNECAAAISMACTTLQNMSRGGIRDQIGYGFYRASITADWSLPQFEKMLYDQAQLISVYLDAFLITHDDGMLGMAYDLIKYITRWPIRAPLGGFFSSEDSESYPEGKQTSKREGAFYVWTYKEILSILGHRDTAVVAAYWDIRSDGNVDPLNDPHDDFINQNVLCASSISLSELAQRFALSEAAITDIIASARDKLYMTRVETRPHPTLDDKIVVSWNALAISALARMAAAVQSVDPSQSKWCLAAATSAVTFIRRELFHEDSGTLYRVWSRGHRGLTEGHCEDYALLICALIDLYEAIFDDTHLAFANTLQKIQLDRFRDPDKPDAGGFFTTSFPHPPDLLFRLKSGEDTAEPSSNNISASNLFRLGSMLFDDSYLFAAKQTVLAFEPEIAERPYNFVGLLGSVVMYRLGMRTVVLTGGEVDSGVLAKLRHTLKPDRTVVRIGGGEGGWLAERSESLRKLDREKKAVVLFENGSSRTGGEELLE